MHNHPPENPFVPQISIFLQSGAIFELRIHLFGLASDVDVVPYNDKLFISGNVQPPILMCQADHNATCSSHNEHNSLLWTDQPYGRFGRDVPSELKPGTECIMLERCQDGGDYVIRYTIRNIKQRSFDPFQQTSHFGSNTVCHGNPVYPHNMNPHSDPSVFARSPFQSYQEEYIVSSEESVFASNFTNARAIFEGTSQSVGVVRSTVMSNIRYTDIQRRFYQIPMQNVSAPAFCNHETVSRAYIPDNFSTMPAGQPVSSCFGLDSSSMGPHFIPSSSLEVPCSAFVDPTINTFLGEEPFNSAMPVPVPGYVCPPMTLDAGAPSFVNYQSSVAPMPIISNTMPMNNPMLPDNLSHVHYSAEKIYSEPSHIIPEANLSAPFLDNTRTAPVVHGPPPVGLTSSSPFNPQTGVNCVLHTGQVPSSSNAIPPAILISSERNLPPPPILPQFDSSPQPHVSIERSSIPTETHQNGFFIPSAVSTANPSANFIPIVPSHQPQSTSRDIPTVQSVPQADIDTSSTLNPSSSTHIGASRVQRVFQRTIPASEVMEHGSSHPIHEAISSGATIGRSVHSVTRGNHDAAVRNVEASHSSVTIREGLISTNDAWTGTTSVLPTLPPSRLVGPMPSASISSPRGFPPGFVPQPGVTCTSEAPVPRPTTAIPAGPSAPEFIIPTLDITRSIPSDAIPTVSPEPTPVGGSSAFNTSTTFLGSSSESAESEITGFPWQGRGSSSSLSRSTTESREIVAQRKTVETMDVAREVSEKIDVEKDANSRKEVRFSLPSVQHAVDTGSKSVSIAGTSDIKATESHSVVSGSPSLGDENLAKSLGISTSGLTIAGGPSTSQQSDIKQETLSISQSISQASSTPSVSSETFVSLGQGDTVIDVAARKIVEVQENTTSADIESVAGQVSSIGSDSSSIVVQALTGAAVEAVQSVLDGETITEAIKHSAGSFIRDVAAQVSGVQNVPILEERGTMESVSSSSSRAGSVSEQTSALDSLLDRHQDVPTTLVAGSMQETAQGTTHTQTVAESSVQHTIEQADATAQLSQSETIEAVVESSSPSKNVTEAAVTGGTTVDSVSKFSASEVTTTETLTTATESSTSSAGIAVTGSSAQTVSAAEIAATVSKSGAEQIGSEDVISEGIVMESEVLKSAVEAGETVKSTEARAAEGGPVRIEGITINSEISKSEVEQIASDATISVGEGRSESQLPVPGPVQTEGAIIESEVLRSEAVQESVTTSASEEHTVAQSAEVGPASTEAIIVGGETGRSTDVIASNATPQVSSSRDVEVNTISVAEMHASDTIITSASSVGASAIDVATSGFQAQSQGHSQITLVHSELEAEKDKASEVDVLAPVNSDVVPVPVPPASSAALRTSTRQDVSFESNTSNMSAIQNVRGQIQSQDVQQYLSEGVTQAGQSTGFSEREFAQTESKTVGEVTRWRTTNTATEESTSRQQEKQKQSDIPSIILLEPSSPVDIVVTVPSSRSSPKVSPTSQDVIEQSMITLDEKTASSSSSKVSALSGSKAKEIEAQTSTTVFPVITSSSSAKLKDTSYTTASSSIALQDDPPPAYSPARMNTLIGQSDNSTLKKNVDVSISIQSEVDQTASTSTQLRSSSTSGLKIEAASVVQEDASHETTGKVVDKTEITTSTAEVSSGLDSHQRPSLMRQSSSFSDFVEVHREESSERETLSLSDSSNSSTVRVKAVKTRPKPPASHGVESRPHGTGACLDECCYWTREIGPAKQRADEQAAQLSDISELTDVDQPTQITRGKMLSDSVYSAKSVDSFVNITKEESTDLRTATEAITIGRVNLGTPVGTTTQNTFTSKIESSDVSQVSEASKTRPDIQFSHERLSSQSTESTYSHTEAGFLQGLHQSAAYKNSGSELRTATTHNQEPQGVLRSKQDLSDAELDYINVHSDQISSSVESLRDGFQAGAQVPTSSGLNSSTKVADTTISGSEARNDITASSTGTKTSFAENTRDDITGSGTIVSGLQQSANDTTVSIVDAPSMSQVETMKQTLEASTVEVTRREGGVSGETISQEAACANTQVGTDEIQNVSEELHFEVVADNSNATSTSTQLGAASQTLTVSESKNQVTGTGSAPTFEPTNTQLVTVGATESTSATTSKNEVTVTEGTSRSNTKSMESESSTRAVTEGAAGEIPASTTSDAVSETIAQLDNASVQTNANTVTSAVSQKNTESSVIRAASAIEVTTETSVAASTEAHIAMSSASKVEESGFSTVMDLGVTTQDTMTATAVESSNESKSQASATSERQTETMETSATASIETQTTMPSVSKIEGTDSMAIVPGAIVHGATVGTIVESSNESISQALAQDNVASATSERQTEITGTSEAASTEIHTAIASVSRVEESESSTLMVSGATAQDTTTATAAESSSGSISQASVQDNVASMTMETSAISERLADNSGAQLVVTSGITSSNEVSQNADSETKLAIISERDSGSESVQAERTVAQEIELSQRTQVSAQSIRSDEATETAYASVQKSSSISAENQESVTETITTGSHFEISNESISSAAEENLVKTTATSDVAAVQEEHHTEIATEAQETSVHRIIEAVKATEDVERDAQARASIGSTSEALVTTSDLESRVFQSSTAMQDVHSVEGPTIMTVGTVTTGASMDAIEQTGQEAQVSESTASVSAEASGVTAQTSTLTAQIAESEMVRSSDMTLSEGVIGASNSVNIDTQTTEQTFLSSNHDIGPSTAATTDAESAGIQPAAEAAVRVREVAVSKGSSEVVIHSEVAEASTSEAGSTAMTAPTGIVGTLESRFAGDMSEKTAISKDDRESTGASVMLGAAEVSTAVTGTSTTSSVTKEAVSSTESSFNQTAANITEGQTSHSSDNRAANIDVQIIEPSVETTEGVTSIVQESHESEQLPDSAVEMIAQKSEDTVDIVEGSTHEDNQQLSVSMESTLNTSLVHREGLHEDSHILIPPPSRRDSMITTSEGSIETTGTIRPFDIRTSMKAVVDAGNVESVLSDSEDKALALSPSTLQSSLIVSTHEDEEHTNVIQTVADIEYSRRNFTPTPEEVPDIDIESDQSVDFHDDESAMTIDVQTVAGYTEGTSSRPISFYSADDRTVNLLTPTDDGDSGSTIFHSGSESTPASRAMTSTIDDFHSMSYMSSPSSGYITERPLVTSPETSPPISTPATTTLSNEQRNTETRIETYNSSSFPTKQSVQEVSFTRNDSLGSSTWERFAPSALFTSRQTGNNNTNHGKRKSVSTTETFQMKRV